MSPRKNIQEILPELFFIQRGFLNANHFVYRGDPVVLIDTGYLGDLEETRQLLACLGIDFSQVGLIVNTHCHCDHVGANQVIQQESGCATALHYIGQHFIATRDDWATWWRYYNQEARFFQATHGLQDLQEIELGCYSFQVLYTPGHSADGLVLYHPQEKILLSSDTLWENDVAAITERVEGSRALFSMQESLQRLQGLEVQMVYPGHGAAFTAYQAALNKAQAKVGRYLQDKKSLGRDQIKKLLVYTLLMHRQMPEQKFFQHLMQTHWFPETVELYFQGGYEEAYQSNMQALLDKGAIYRKAGCLYPGVAP
ncbi:MAG: MBL fold metallo-hydrolase [Desulfohalobiaceae bacterium]